MIGQGIQKHNPGSRDEGYITRSPTPANFGDGAIDEPDDEGTSNRDVLNETFMDEFENEDTLNASYKTCPEYIENTGEPDDHNMDELEGLEVVNAFQPEIYKQVDECVRKNTLSTLLNTRRQDSTSHLYSGETVEEGIIKELLELIALGEDKKILFGMPCNVFSENTSLIDFLVRNLYTLKMRELSAYEKCQLDLLSSKISGLVSTGIYMSEEALKFLPPDLLEKRNNYLSNLKQIVCDSIENDKKDGVILERDNGLYYIKCPEESVITPAKFLSNQEFQNLDGALEIGEGNVIRTQNGQYHDMRGEVKMTFTVGDGEKIEMILSAEKAEGFGAIIVHMDDKNCEIFSKYCEELEKEPRISKVVEAAKSFVEEKKGKQSEPFSVLEEVSILKCSHYNHRHQG